MLNFSFKICFFWDSEVLISKILCWCGFRLGMFDNKSSSLAVRQQPALNRNGRFDEYVALQGNVQVSSCCYLLVVLLCVRKCVLSYQFYFCICRYFMYRFVPTDSVKILIGEALQSTVPKENNIYILSMLMKFWHSPMLNFWVLE